MKQTKGVGFEGGIRGRSHTSPWEKKKMTGEEAKRETGGDGQQWKKKKST